MRRAVKRNTIPMSELPGGAMQGSTMEDFRPTLTRVIERARSITRLRQRQARSLTSALLVATVGLAACGDEGGNGTATGADGEATEEIVIETRVVFPESPEGPVTGEVLDGSAIGDSPFCPGGTFEDQHGTEDPSEPPYGLVDRTYECPDGTLRMGFSPGHPEGGVQSGPWTIVSGTGAYEGLQGTGQMETAAVPGGGEAGETFTGTVSTAGG
jgi:hypothetical protein